MSLRGWGHSVRRLTPWAISHYLRNTQKWNRLSLKLHTQTWTGEDKLPPSLLQHLYTISDLLITHNYKDKYTHLSSSWLSSLRYRTESLPSLCYPVITHNFWECSLPLCSQLALSGRCLVSEAAVIYHPVVKRRGLARTLLVRFTVWRKISRGRGLCYKLHQLFIR